VKYLTATFPNDGLLVLTLTATWTGMVGAPALPSQEMQPIVVSNARQLQVR
jgi:tyrosyl-tRNA synthetase